MLSTTITLNPYVFDFVMVGKEMRITGTKYLGNRYTAPSGKVKQLAYKKAYGKFMRMLPNYKTCTQKRSCHACSDPNCDVRTQPAS